MNVCERAIEEIEKRGWGQGSFKKDDGSVCLLGALHAATGEIPDFLSDHYARPDLYAAMQAVIATVAPEAPFAAYPVALWNDFPGRTEDEVLEALRLAGKDLANRSSIGEAAEGGLSE